MYVLAYSCQWIVVLNKHAHNINLCCGRPWISRFSNEWTNEWMNECDIAYIAFICSRILSLSMLLEILIHSHLKYTSVCVCIATVTSTKSRAHKHHKFEWPQFCMQCTQHSRERTQTNTPKQESLVYIFIEYVMRQSPSALVHAPSSSYQYYGWMFNVHACLHIRSKLPKNIYGYYT